MSTAELLAKRRKADRGAPRLWVRRFVLFERIGKELSRSSIIRDLTLKRGLNIIQGLEASANGTEKKQPRGLTEGVYKKLKGRCKQESYKEIRRCQQNRPFSAQSPAEFC